MKNLQTIKPTKSRTALQMAFTTALNYTPTDNCVKDITPKSEQKNVRIYSYKLKEVTLRFIVGSGSFIFGNSNSYFTTIMMTNELGQTRYIVTYSTYSRRDALHKSIEVFCKDILGDIEFGTSLVTDTNHLYECYDIMAWNLLRVMSNARSSKHMTKDIIYL